MLCCAIRIQDVIVFIFIANDKTLMTVTTHVLTCSTVLELDDGHPGM